jgi:hypothetical protein
VRTDCAIAAVAADQIKHCQAVIVASDGLAVDQQDRSKGCGMLRAGGIGPRERRSSSASRFESVAGIRPASINEITLEHCNANLCSIEIAADNQPCSTPSMGFWALRSARPEVKGAETLYGFASSGG